MISKAQVLVLVMAVSMTACSLMDKPKPAKSRVEDRRVSHRQATPEKQQSEKLSSESEGESKSKLSVESVKPVEEEHPAITTLLDQALERQRSGDLDQSAALIERAVRIAPQDPLAWNRLAFIRLQQNDWTQAEQLAMKSNSFADGQSNLQLRNWRIIAEARKRLGNKQGAQTAANKADTLTE